MHVLLDDYLIYLMIIWLIIWLIIWWLCVIIWFELIEIILAQLFGLFDDYQPSRYSAGGPCPLALLRSRGVGNHRYCCGAAATTLNPTAAMAPQRPPENVQPLRHRCCVGRYVVFTAPLHCPVSCRCSGDSASRGGDGDCIAYTVAYKDNRCQQLYI